MDRCKQQNTVYLFLQDDFEKNKKGKKKDCMPEREPAAMNFQELTAMPDSHV